MTGNTSTKRQRVNHFWNQPPKILASAGLEDSIWLCPIEGRRELLLHCTVYDSAAGAHFDLDSTSAAFDIAVNGVRAEHTGAHPQYRWLDVAGLWSDGFDVSFTLDPRQPFACQVLSRIMGLPAVQGFQGYPLNMIPGPGPFANTTVASKYYVFKPR